MEIRIGKEARLQDSTGHGFLTAAPSPKRGRMGLSLIFYSAGSSSDPAGFQIGARISELSWTDRFRPRTAARCAHWPGRG